MRLIDEAALINEAETGSWDIDLKELKMILKYVETISAMPVVRGEWVEAKSGCMSVWPPGQVMCSVCKQRMPSQWKKMPPYCYGCGAKMDEKEHNNA